MPIDPSIALSIRPVQMPDPLEGYGRMMQLRAAQRQNKLADLAFADRERATQDANAISGLYRDATGADGSFDRQKFLAGAAQKGYGARIPEWQKGFAETDEATSKAEKERLAAASGQIALLGQVAGAAVDQQSYTRGRQMLQAAGIDIASIPEQYDPQYVAQARMQALDAQKQLEEILRQKNYGLQVKRLEEDKRHNQAQEATASRAASVQANMGKPPAGYRWGADGNLQAIPGGPADKAATVSEGERNAAGFAERMGAAEDIIGAVATKDSGAQKPGFIEQLAGNGMIGNASRSDTRQQYRQAQEDWVRSKLRKESGAAIGADEMEREISMYFPQIGDSNAVIQQKAKARATAVEAMRKSAGRASPKAEPKAEPKASEAPDDINELLSKYGS